MNPDIGRAFLAVLLFFGFFLALYWTVRSAVRAGIEDAGLRRERRREVTAGSATVAPTTPEPAIAEEADAEKSAAHAS